MEIDKYTTCRNKFKFRYLTNILFVTLVQVLTPANASFQMPSGFIGGTSFVSFDHYALATMFSEYQRTDNKGIPYGDPQPTSDTAGNRFLYIDRYIDSSQDSVIKPSGYASDSRIANGTADPIAVQQWRVFDPSQSVPLEQPRGGYQLPVDQLSAGVDWARGPRYGWASSNFDPDPNSQIPLQISLGGTFRMHSDFAAPGGSLWFANLDLQYNAMGDTGKWYIGAAQGQGIGSIFELINPVFGVNAATGFFSLEADFKWGDSAWSSFFNLEEAVNGKVMGHISINPTAVVPVPTAIWLFGSALFGLVGFKRRPLKCMALLFNPI